MMFCHARPRKRSFVTWHASAIPSGAHCTCRRWCTKTATAWKKACKDAYGRSGPAGDQDPARAEAEQEPDEQRPGDERRHREAPADLEELDDDVEDRAAGDREEDDLERWADPRLADQRPEEGRAAADQSHQAEEAPARALGLAGHRANDAEALGRVVQ